MLVEVRQFVDKFHRSTDRFESLINSLVRESARVKGIPQSSIHWDENVFAKDGGRDLWIDHKYDGGDAEFLPKRQSYWSVKSGDDGGKLATFRNELKEHPKVVAWLRGGHDFVWCAACSVSKDRKEKFKAEVSKVLRVLNRRQVKKIRADQFHFHWHDALTDELNQHICVVSHFFPEHLDRLGEGKTLREWGRDFSTSPAWQAFGKRDTSLSFIGNHLEKTTLPNTLHVAGLSGIGKSRLAYEACIRHAELFGTPAIYFPGSTSILANADTVRLFTESNRHAILVVDEVKDEQEQRSIANQFGDCGERIRLITIGYTRKQEPRQQPELLVLEEPRSAEEVQLVISEFGKELPRSVLERIAEKSNHDLRLATLLVQSFLLYAPKNGFPELDANGIWKRIMLLFGIDQGDADRLKEIYSDISCFIDLGWRNEYVSELDVVARYFKLRRREIPVILEQAASVGLGHTTKNFFEPIPRALAAAFFEERCWPKIRDDLNSFLQAMPLRLVRRFLERCHDCTKSRNEVQERLESFFQKALSEAEPSVSEFPAFVELIVPWIEFDPKAGLSWLERLLSERVTKDQIFGGNGRSLLELAWLCDSLARFPEHFEKCEKILFMLALAESKSTEDRYCYESWKALFWLDLHVFGLPFEERTEYLKKRLRSQDRTEMQYAFEAAIGVLEFRAVGNPIPSSFVGGIAAPKPSYPITWQEHFELQQEIAREILDFARRSHESDAAEYCTQIVAQLQAFVCLELFKELEELTDILKSCHSLDTVAKIDELLGFVEKDLIKDPKGKARSFLRRWRKSFIGSSLVERIKLITSQKYWDLYDHESQTDPFSKLAQEASMKLKLISTLEPWFSSAAALSAFEFGSELGSLCHEKKWQALIEKWIRGQNAELLTLGFLAGQSKNGLADHWSNLLDELLEKNLPFVVKATHSADISVRGFERLLKALALGFRPIWQVCAPFGYGCWLNVLKMSQKKKALQELQKGMNEGEEHAGSTALDLLGMFAHRNQSKLPKSLARIAMSLLQSMTSLRRTRDSYRLKEISRLLLHHEREAVCRFVLRSITDETIARPSFSDVVDLVRSCAEIAPKQLLNELVDVWNDRKRRPRVQVHVFTGSMDAIGVDLLEEAISKYGVFLLPYMARHMSEPYIDDQKQIAIPPVTNWLFTTHGLNDEAFQSFLSGRHSGVEWRSDNEYHRIFDEMKPFLEHPNKRVREWAKKEIDSAKSMTNWFEELDEERDRM